MAINSTNQCPLDCIKTNKNRIELKWNESEQLDLIGMKAAKEFVGFGVLNLIKFN